MDNKKVEKLFLQVKDLNYDEWRALKIAVDSAFNREKRKLEQQLQLPVDVDFNISRFSPV